MFSTETGLDLILFVDRDESRRTRVIDAVTERRGWDDVLTSFGGGSGTSDEVGFGTWTPSIAAVASASAAHRRLETEGTVDCLVVGEAIEGEDGCDVESFLSSLAADYPDVPIVRFASETTVGTDGVAHVDSSSDTAIEHLVARLEAICARRRAETLEGALDHVTDTAADGIAQVGNDGRIVAFSPSFAETFGRDPHELRGASIASLYDCTVDDWADAVPGSDRDVDSDAATRTKTTTKPGLATGTDIEPETSPFGVFTGDADRWTGHLVGRTADGDPIEREHDVRRTAPDRLTWLVHSVPGPSDRDEVLTNHRILESMLERLPISLYAKDEDARHIRTSQDQVDPPFEARDGTMLTDPAQLLGKTDRDLYGSTLSDESIADDRRVIETGEPVVETVERYDVRPGEERWTLTSKVPWTDDDGTRRGLVGVTTDITAKIEHERAAERRRKRLEEFASVVAHDLRNPLTVASGYVELARQTGSTAPLADAEESLGRMERIVEDVLLLAREGNAVLEETPVELRPVVEEAWKQISTKDATLHVVGDARFLADRGRLLRLVENLLRNAVEHGGDRVTITVEPLEGANGSADGYTDGCGNATEPDGYGFGFAIEDDGLGIPPDDRESILESGYTTSREGTGFGLAIVTQIADAHGWDLAVTESDDGGARFEITGLEPSE